jgi:hypothetical protein
VGRAAARVATERIAKKEEITDIMFTASARYQEESEAQMGLCEAASPVLAYSFYISGVGW